jgi:hypothetical protein
MAAVALIAIFPSGRLPGYVPGDMPDPSPDGSK